MPALGIHQSGYSNGLTLAVVTPIGPGHAKSYTECKATIEQAIRKNRGPFSRIEIVAIDDSQGTKGRSRARNEGVLQASELGADWIFLLDADDLLFDDAFAQFVPYEANHDAVWGAIIELSPDSTQPQLRLPQALSLETRDELLMFDPFHTLQMGHFVRTTVARSIPFDESMDAGEDFDYYLKVWNKARCGKVPVEFFINRRGNHSVGPRSADGGDWCDTVRTLINNARRERGLHTEGLQTIALRKRCVKQLQHYYRKNQAPCDVETVAKSFPCSGLQEFPTVSGRPFLMNSSNDDIVALNYAWQGSYEAASTQLWQKLSRGCRLVLDLNAHTGFYSFLAARTEPDCTVVGFEPLARNFARFVMNRNLNNFANVHPVRAVASDSHGTFELPSHRNNELLLPFPSLIGRQDDEACEQELVSSISVDEFLAQNDLPQVDLIRLCSATAEIDAIQGMQQTLASHHPDLLIACQQDADTVSLTQFLQSHGYNFFRIHESPATLEQTDGLAPASGEDDCNRIATTRSAAEIAAFCTVSEAQSAAAVA